VNDLLAEWLRLMSDVVEPGTDLELVAGAGRELLHRWAEPHRRYHDVEHLATVLSIVDELTASAEVRLAAWYHDAVYDPRAVDNEERSALLAVDAMSRLGVAPGTVDEVARLVRLTATHDPSDDDVNGRVLSDADLAVLARPWDEYQRYAAAVREEYRHVSDEDFRIGRAAVLRHLLDLPLLYRSPELHERWEAPARANLRRELEALS
jgi:predicted metal-dependent HD superfamily phosphohydrolase